VKYQLSNSIQAIFAQNLLPRADDGGLVLACEILTATPAVRRHIRESETHMLLNEMQTGRKHQMQTMDNALLALYQRGEITYDTALSSARDPDTIRKRAGASAKAEH
jgi:twitching motility protein PilT